MPRPAAPPPETNLAPHVTQWLDDLVQRTIQQRSLTFLRPPSFLWNTETVPQLLEYLNHRLAWYEKTSPPRHAHALPWSAFWEALSPGMPFIQSSASVWLKHWCGFQPTPWHLQAVGALLPTLLKEGHLLLPMTAPLEKPTDPASDWLYLLLTHVRKALPLEEVLRQLSPLPSSIATPLATRATAVVTLKSTETIKALWQCMHVLLTSDAAQTMSPTTHHWKAVLCQNVLRWHCLPLSSDIASCLQPVEALLPPLSEKLALCCVLPKNKQEWNGGSKGPHHIISGWEWAEEVLLEGCDTLLDWHDSYLFFHRPMYQEDRMSRVLETWITTWKTLVASWPPSAHDTPAAHDIEHDLLSFHERAGLPGAQLVAHRLVHALDRTPPHSSSSAEDAVEGVRRRARV